MSALDIISQRQVPARPPVRQNDADAPRSGDDPFAKVLSGHQRQDGDKPDRADAGATSDKEPVDPIDVLGPAGDQETSDKGDSDEMLALLEGLMSSAAYPEDTQAANEDAGAEELVDAGAKELVDAGAKELVDAGAKELVDAGEEAAMAGMLEETADAALRDEQADFQSDAGKASAAQGREPAATGTAQQTHSHLAATGNPAAAVTAAFVSNGATVSNRSMGAEAQPDRGERKPSDSIESLRAGTTGQEAGPVRPGPDKPLNLEGRVRAAAEGRQQEDRLDGKAQNVEVLESRRFMATQAMGGNAQMLTRSLVDTGREALQANRAAPVQSAAIPGQPQVGQMLHTLKLQLNPVSLGSVTAVLKLSGEELSVDIKVQTAEAYRQLSDDNQVILKALRAQGFGVEQINIQHVVVADRAANQPQQQTGVQNNFQGPGSGDAQASGRETGGQGGRNQFGSQGDGQGHDQKPYSSPDARRSDGVYL